MSDSIRTLSNSSGTSSKMESVPDVSKVTHILDDMIDDLEIISRLPPSFHDFDPNLYAHLPSDLSSALEEHYELESELEEQLESLIYEQDKSEALELADLLKETQKQICRLVRESGGACILPDISKQLRHSHVGVENMENFLETMKLLRHLSLLKLNTSAEDERVRMDSLNEAQKKHERTRNDIKKYSTELELEKSRRKREVSEKEESIRRLKDELEFLQSKHKTEIDGFSRYASERENTAEHVFHTKLSAMESEIEKLRSGLEQIRAENKAMENKKLTEKRLTEKDLESLLTEYDQEMTNYTNENNLVLEQLNRDTELLNQLETELEQLREEAQLRAERDAKEREEDEQKKSAEYAYQQAAIMVQSMFRGWYFRNKPKKKGKAKKS